MVDKNETNPPKSFLQKLRADTTGNTLAMAAAAIFPIIGVIGGGVDIGRGYMAKARLQQACDAGALAARRSMTADTISPTDQAIGRQFFDFNFPEGTFGTDPFVQVNGEDNPRFVNGTEARTVSGYAETTIPTALMRVFGNDTMEIKVSCTTRLDVGNVDVMMVLDLSGSMDWKADGSTTTVESEKRIFGLRNAVKDFYGTLGTGGGGGAVNNQIRYGFANYNSQVNVGKLLYDADPTWLVGGTADERWTYQTRRATWEITDPDFGPPKSSDTVESFESYTFLDGPECVNGYGNNEGVPGWFTPANTDNPIVSSTDNGTETTVTTVEYDYESWNGDTAPPPPDAVGQPFWEDCVRKVTTTTEVFDNPVPETVDVWEPGATNFSGWEYGQFSHDVSGYVASIDPNNDPVQRPTENGLQLDRWDGCIEERDTDATITKDSTSITAAALDLDIDLLPTDTASRWRPLWRQIIYRRNGTTVGSSSCTSPSRRLAQYASVTSPGLDSVGNEVGGNFTTYVDGLTATGATNHTIGLIWGARMLSENGLFATENQYTGNGFPIGRHLVFMTDGVMNFNGTSYNPYGYNELDGRIAPTGTSNGNLDQIQSNRFQLMCQAIRNQGITIWVVQFGVNNVTANMESCASSADHAAPATDNDQLQAAFSNIAKTIGGLRVSQ